MANFSSRRILYELKQLSKDPPLGYSVDHVADDKYYWAAHIIGSDDSPYAGGVFFLTLHFPPDYPLRPPGVHFKTKVFHPNINSHGSIDLRILREKWSPVFVYPRFL